MLCFLRVLVSQNICVRGRTQVEVGTKTVLGIGPGKSPVMRDEIILIIFLFPVQHQ